MDKVSVVLTSYNHAEYIDQSIKSILAQTYGQFELYIIDDCSTDDSWERICSYEDKRIHSSRLEKNTGCAYLPYTISTLKAHYIAIAHCDDCWKPDKLEKQVAYLDNHPEVAACFTRVQLIDEEGQPFNENGHIYADIFDKENRTRQEWLQYFFDYGNCLCHPSVLIRAEAYSKYNLFTQGLSGIPDFVQWIRLCRHAEIWIYPEKLTCFRIRKNEQNTSGDAAEKHYRNFIEQYLTLGEYVNPEDEQEFLKVFPQAAQYVVGGELIPSFAYARILLQQPNSPMKHLYAYRLLYGLMQNETSRDKLERLYGYTGKEFAQDKQREDVFSLIPKESFMQACLYFNCGEGFTEKLSVKKTIYITHDNRFYVEFQVPVGYLAIKALRFDPDANFWRFYKINSILVDGKPAHFQPLGAERAEGKDYFYTLDSQYLIELEQESDIERIEITGTTGLISAFEIDKTLQNSRNELMQFKVQEAQTKQRLQAAQVESQTLSQQKNSLLESQTHLRKHEQELETELMELTGTIRNHPVKMALKILLKRI
ncbi:hypothetical protein SDC9_55106 [bioreactor metagenome]|uniref:Glycosyltransferase 2-like domain-containing protein n=1 Tax=bioreactor metagenome TaxID=1076179 RepID=A0A644WY05_9ZZZZ